MIKAIVFDCYGVLDLDRLDLSFPEFLFIDDAPSNTGAAKTYGMHAITYHNPRQLTAGLHQAGVL